MWGKLLVLFLTLFTLVGCQHEEPDYDSAYTPAPPQPPLVSMGVIGDSYSAGSDYGGNGVNGWPYIVSTRIDNMDLVVHNAAVKGAGYVHGNSRGVKFADEIADLTGGERVVVVAGSINDRGTPPVELRAAALDVLRGVQVASPNAAIIVIGPIWVGPPPGRRVLSLRDEVEAAADELGLQFVDPIAEGWLADRPDLIGADGKHPTDEGHVYLADRITPLVEAQLAASPQP